MFAKLLKQEWRSCKSVIGLLCMIILISGALIGGSGFYLAWMGDRRAAGDDSLVNILVLLLMMAAMMAIAICCAGGVFYLVWRFYRSRFTDEGYLTFTLPVNHHQLLLSNILNSLWSLFLVILAAIGAMILALGLLLLAYNQKIIWQDTFYAVRRIWPDLVSSFQKNWREFTVFFASGITSLVSGLITLMLSVTVGAMIARRHHFLGAVAVYYGIGMVKSVAMTMLGLANMESENALWLLHTPMIMGLVTIGVGYFLMYWLTSRKLNLT